MTKKELVEIFSDDERFDGKNLHDAVFDLEPEKAYDILEEIYGIDELRKIPEEVDLDFDLDAYDEFLDDLADEVLDKKDFDEVAKELGTETVDLDMLERVPEAVKKIEKERTIDASNVVLFDEVLKFVKAANKKWGIGDRAISELEELKSIADEWSIEDD